MTVIYVICKLLRLDRMIRLKKGDRLFLAGIAMAAGGMYGAHLGGALLGWPAVVVIGALLYFGESWYDPWVDCWACGGRNKRRSNGGEGSTFHYCRMPRWAAGCDGSGRRLRVLPMITGWGNGL